MKWKFHSLEDYSKDGPVYETKHVVRNKNNTSNKLIVVYDYIILQFYNFIPHVLREKETSIECY
jgi:hypothetical protein